MGCEGGAGVVYAGVLGELGGVVAGGVLLALLLAVKVGLGGEAVALAAGELPGDEVAGKVFAGGEFLLFAARLEELVDQGEVGGVDLGEELRGGCAWGRGGGWAGR